ncbi:MAG: UDP-N-acetylglucosamine--N-acetylmuramyl-(pentapeptide) pyrophosphoryl-undecaprenol N-acetylglucosamine transferase [Planctomycetota bacterium]
MRASDRARIALAGGGSGGHLFPGIALAQALGERPVLYGSKRKGEAEWVGADAERVVLDSPLLPASRRDVPRFCVRLARAVHESVREMRARRTDLVVGLGGYASVAPGMAAILTRRPLLLLEQNAVPGKANRLLARLGGRLAASYPESLGALDARARRRARVVGNPVRSGILSGVRKPISFGLHPDRPVLLVVGGSQGATGLNERVLAAAGDIAARGVQVLHLTGSGSRDSGAEETARRNWRDRGVRAWVSAFTSDMGTLYATADLVLSRAGGTTLAELTATGRPSVLVPYPHHADRHQERNARVMVSTGAARIVPEAELTRERFGREVLDLVTDREALGAMAAAAGGLGVPDAADRIATWARELIAERTEA